MCSRKKHPCVLAHTIFLAEKWKMQLLTVPAGLHLPDFARLQGSIMGDVRLWLQQLHEACLSQGTHADGAVEKCCILKSCACSTLKLQ
jgi:hypothetical protein